MHVTLPTGPAPRPAGDATLSHDAQAAGSQRAGATAPDRSTDVGRASQQFESILVRQFLNDSMKPLLQGGPSGQVYGYFLTDTLADSLAKGGGLGLASVFQAQLGGKEVAR